MHLFTFWMNRAYLATSSAGIWHSRVQRIHYSTITAEVKLCVHSRLGHYHFERSTEVTCAHDPGVLLQHR